MTEKNIIIIAGPNGAGKTTFAREFLPQEAGCPIFINADLIAQGLSPFRPEAAAVRAGRIMLEMIADCVRRATGWLSFFWNCPARNWLCNASPTEWRRAGTTFQSR